MVSELYRQHYGCVLARAPGAVTPASLLNNCICRRERSDLAPLSTRGRPNDLWRIHFFAAGVVRLGTVFIMEHGIIGRDRHATFAYGICWRVDFERMGRPRNATWRSKENVVSNGILRVMKYRFLK